VWREAAVRSRRFCSPRPPGGQIGIGPRVPKRLRVPDTDGPATLEPARALAPVQTCAAAREEDRDGGLALASAPLRRREGEDPHSVDRAETAADRDQNHLRGRRRPAPRPEGCTAPTEPAAARGSRGSSVRTQRCSSAPEQREVRRPRSAPTELREHQGPRAQHEGRNTIASPYRRPELRHPSPRPALPRASMPTRSRPRFRNTNAHTSRAAAHPERWHITFSYHAGACECRTGLLGGGPAEEVRARSAKRSGLADQ